MGCCVRYRVRYKGQDIFLFFRVYFIWNEKGINNLGDILMLISFVQFLSEFRVGRNYFRLGVLRVFLGNYEIQNEFLRLSRILVSREEGSGILYIGSGVSLDIYRE